jgi:hypothetical protein
MANVELVLRELERMNNDELKRVVEKIKDVRVMLGARAARTFVVGDLVSFDARGMAVLGTVTKVNRKNILVKEKGGFTTWRVPAVMLKPVREMSVA